MAQIFRMSTHVKFAGIARQVQRSSVTQGPQISRRLAQDFPAADRTMRGNDITYSVMALPVFQTVNPAIQMAVLRNVRAGEFRRVSSQQQCQFRNESHDGIRRMTGQMPQMHGTPAKVEVQLPVEYDRRRNKVHAVPHAGFPGLEVAQGPGRLALKTPGTFPVPDNHGTVQSGRSLYMIPVRMAVGHQTGFMKSGPNGGQVPGMAKRVPKQLVPLPTLNDSIFAFPSSSCIIRNYYHKLIVYARCIGYFR